MGVKDWVLVAFLFAPFVIGLGLALLHGLDWVLERLRPKPRTAPSKPAPSKPLPFVLTTHARERMAEREVFPHQIEQVLAAPREITPTKDGKVRLEGRIGTRTLRVVVADYGTREPVVVTTAWKGDQS